MSLEIKQMILDGKSRELAGYLVKNSHLPGKMANLRLAKEVQEMMEDLVAIVGFKSLFSTAKDMEIHEHEYVRLVAGHAFGAIGERHQKEVMPHLRRLAEDESWRVREGAAEGIGRLLCHHFPWVCKELKEWIKSGTPNLRRAAAVGSISMMSYNEAMMKEKTPEILDLLKRNMFVEHEYVSKGMSFALNILGWKNPGVVFARLDKWLAEKKFAQSETALRTMIRSLDSRFGMKNPKEATVILEKIRLTAQSLQTTSSSQKVLVLIEKIEKKLHQ